MVEGGGAVDQAGNLALAEPLSMTNLNGGVLFNAEFGIKHRGTLTGKIKGCTQFLPPP